MLFLLFAAPVIARAQESPWCPVLRLRCCFSRKLR